MALSKLPKEIKIASRTVKIETIPLEGDGLLGYFDHNQQAIYLSTDIQSADVLMETFWHELIHAINDYVRFEVEFQREVDDRDDLAVDAFNFNETFTEGFSKVLLQVIRDNNLLALE